MALLQYVRGIPSSILRQYSSKSAPSTDKTGRHLNYENYILVRGEFGSPLTLSSSFDWANAHLRQHAGRVMAWQAKTRTGLGLNILGVYNPDWALSRASLGNTDTSGVRLRQNAHVWIADLLWSALQSHPPQPDEPWIIAGTFNLSETFDARSDGPRGNREYLDRMARLGLTECLRNRMGSLTPTYRDPADGHIEHQLDYFYITEALRPWLVACTTGDATTVFGTGLSNHLPIVADFAAR